MEASVHHAHLCTAIRISDSHGGERISHVFKDEVG
jgi:hypothetical protein